MLAGNLPGVGVVVFVAMAALPLGQPQAPTYKNSVAMEFVLIKPGTFTLGRFEPAYAKPDDANAAGPSRGGRGRAMPPLSADDYRRIEDAWRKDLSPGFKVTISQPFYIGVYEVTQAEYREVMGRNPSVFQRPLIQDPSDRHPVDNVTWDDAQAFVRKLNDREKTDLYRLPTEFEWEFAARGGSDEELSWADRRLRGFNSGQTTQPVGKMLPNAFGLHDTLGNVWEWVRDYYNEKVFADPTPPRSGKQHVLKGGSFTSDVANVSYTTHAAGPANKFDVGFRVVKDVR